MLTVLTHDGAVTVLRYDAGAGRCGYTVPLATRPAGGRCGGCSLKDGGRPAGSPRLAAAS